MEVGLVLLGEKGDGAAFEDENEQPPSDAAMRGADGGNSVSAIGHTHSTGPLHTVHLWRMGF